MRLTLLIASNHSCPMDRPMHFWKFKSKPVQTTENVSEINSNGKQRKTNSCSAQRLISGQNIYLEMYTMCDFSPLFPSLRHTGAGGREGRDCKNKVGSKLANVGRFRKKWKPAYSLYLIPLIPSLDDTRQDNP